MPHDVKPRTLHYTVQQVVDGHIFVPGCTTPKRPDGCTCAELEQQPEGGGPTLRTWVSARGSEIFCGMHAPKPLQQYAREHLT